MKSTVWRRSAERLGFAVTYGAAFVSLLALVSIIAFIVVEAWPALNWSFIVESPRDMMTAGGVWPCILGTFCLSFGALAIALPLGVASAVYLVEYSDSSGWGTTLIRLSIANLAGVPSIIFGLFGLTFFCIFLGLGVSLVSGVLTLALLSLPIIINTTEAALLQIPQEWREASLALGATRRETSLKITLPNALPGILTGAILGLARAAGETAAIMYTGSVFLTPREDVSLLEPVMALPYHIYVLATSGTNIEATRPLQYAASFLLLALVLCMSSVAIWIRERSRKN